MLVSGADSVSLLVREREALVVCAMIQEVGYFLVRKTGQGEILAWRLVCEGRQDLRGLCFHPGCARRLKIVSDWDGATGGDHVLDRIRGERSAEKLARLTPNIGARHACASAPQSSPTLKGGFDSGDIAASIIGSDAGGPRHAIHDLPVCDGQEEVGIAFQRPEALRAPRARQAYREANRDFDAKGRKPHKKVCLSLTLGENGCRAQRGLLAYKVDDVVSRRGEAFEKISAEGVMQRLRALRSDVAKRALAREVGDEQGTVARKSL